MDLDKLRRRCRYALEGDMPMIGRVVGEDVPALLAEVERLRQMILYALAGPDEDLPEALGGRAVAITKKILRDALGAEGL